MIEITNIAIWGFEHAVRGMRNPMNSWEKSDSVFCMGAVSLGDADLALMKKLIVSGTDHSKFMRMIEVSMDINAPLYWWKEFDAYKVGTVANSCSTMHKIHGKEFTLDDFSHEHICDDVIGGICKHDFSESLEIVIHDLNLARKLFIETKDKKWWWQMIQLLPNSYNQLRTITLNYQALRNMYHARKNHKLDEWHDFCRMIETLPYSELITMEGKVKTDD